jgi:predicted ATPase with chaperone activity
LWGWIKAKKLQIDVEPAIFEDAEALMFPLAVAILLATGKLRNPFENYLIVGGLGVTGSIYGVEGLPAIGKMANGNNMQGIIIPHSNGIENFNCSIPVYHFKHLDSLINLCQNYDFSRKIKLPPALFKNLNFN